MPIPPTPNFDALVTELSRLRRAAGMTYDALAEKSGLNRSTVIYLETRRRHGDLTTWHAVAHALDVPLGDLLNHLCEDHPPPGP